MTVNVEFFIDSSPKLLQITDSLAALTSIGQSLKELVALLRVILVKRPKPERFHSVSPE
jgi:hypothetical protein